MKFSEFNNICNEEVKSLKGKYLQFPNGTVSLDNDTAVIVSNKSVDNGKLYIYKGRPYLDAGRYDKSFKDIDELTKYLNDEKFEYIGIDDI